MNTTLENFLISFIATLFGILLIILIDRLLLPKLSIINEERGNQTATYNGVTWKFFRLIIQNKAPIEWLTKYIKPAQTAHNCHSNIKIYQNQNLLFDIKGRWSNTKEIPSISDPYERFRVSQFPEPINIMSGREELLDLLAFDITNNEVYKWNNENYILGWNFNGFKLNPGKYQLLIEIFSDNSISYKRKAELTIGNTIADLSIILK